MACNDSINIALRVLFFALFMNSLSAARMLLAGEENNMVFKYHDGPLLTGTISVNLVWYGKFNPSQRAVVSDFVTSLSSATPSQAPPSVATWWSSIEKYYHVIKSNNKTPPSPPKISLGKQILLDDNNKYSSPLRMAQVEKLAMKGGVAVNSINVVLTSSDVAVEGFCSSKCGTHGVVGEAAYIWVGNSEKQCPGQCAWPFHKPIYGPQTPALVAPNGDVGVDGIVINLAGLLAGTVTNPSGKGYYQGPAAAPLEAASACPGVFGRGAYPGYAGELLVDTSSGASYNAKGANGRKYLLPALYDLSSQSCSTLV